MHTFQYVHMQGTTKGEENGEGHACIYRVNEPSRNADHFFGHSNTSLLLAMSLSKWQKTTHEVDEVICLSCHFLNSLGGIKTDAQSSNNTGNQDYQIMDCQILGRMSVTTTQMGLA